MQHTLSSPVKLSGIGLHSGRDISMTLNPAPADYGIVFSRTDLEPGSGKIPALWDRVTDTTMCTVIANEAGAQVGTVEHLMAALRGCGVDNVLIEIDGPEVPVMDGSAMPFVEAIDAAGVTPQAAPRRVIKILKPVKIERDGKHASLSPAAGSVFNGSIDYDHPNIGTQRYEMRLLNGNFKHDLAEARTFGFIEDVETLRAQGLALGGSLDNAIVLDRDGVINSGGLRWRDEFIRHKVLDAIGDLYLAGGPIIGAYEGEKAGHALNNALLHALFADEDAWEWTKTGEMAGVRPENAASDSVPVSSWAN